MQQTILNEWPNCGPCEEAAAQAQLIGAPLKRVIGAPRECQGTTAVDRP